MSDNPFPVPPPIQNPPSSGTMVPRDKNDNSLGILCHLLAFATFIVPFAGSILGPLVLWLVKRGDSPYIDEVGKEVLNFNISWFIYSLLAGLSLIVLIGLVLLPLIWLTWLILVIVGAIKASEGKIFRYPLTIRLIN
jgi:uncharacterized Tic20 family protein